MKFKSKAKTLYDSYFRFILLTKSLKLIKKNNDHIPMIDNNLKYNSYFIDHPVFKHISIISKY